MLSVSSLDMYYIESALTQSSPDYETCCDDDVPTLIERLILVEEALEDLEPI